MPIHKSNQAVYPITDLVNLEYQPAGYHIFKTRAVISRIYCEKTESKVLLVFGEYIFFLVLKGLTRKGSYSIKTIKCPFIKALELDDNQYEAYSAADIFVRVTDEPSCVLDHLSTKSSNKSQLYRITLSYNVELALNERPESVNQAHDESEGHEARVTGMKDPGSVKVWRVEGTKKHTIEQLLGIDKDTLNNFNKSMES